MYWDIVTDSDGLRSQFSQLLETDYRESKETDLDDTYCRFLALTAIKAGKSSSNMATAFFCGYQLAMRRLDPQLPTDCWAAFCVNESKVSSLSAMTTRWHSTNQTLSGRKSFALMAGKGLDIVYVVAIDDQAVNNGKVGSGKTTTIPPINGAPRNDGAQSSKNQLVTIRLDINDPAIKITPPTQPGRVFPDLPHAKLEFEQVTSEQGCWQADAYRRHVKPFRYWEDVFLLLSLAGWMSGHGAGSGNLDNISHNLVDYFSCHPHYYDLNSLQLVEDVIAQLQLASQGLPAFALAEWQRDSQLLMMGEKIRGQIRKNLLAG